MRSLREARVGRARSEEQRRHRLQETQRSCCLSPDRRAFERIDSEEDGVLVVVEMRILMPCGRRDRLNVRIVFVAMAVRAVMMPMRVGCQMEMRTRVVGWLTVLVSVPQRRRRRQQQGREQQNCDRAPKHRLLQRCPDSLVPTSVYTSANLDSTGRFNNAFRVELP